ncbi:FliM/FliN family flagellar motor C-terminal domain-containing protein [Roseiconus lacunae]|uniref:Flagellar motor switch protein FliN n=1 Tax=Roseiconus lacunae TaxID=2605694 RepID=A0ABT7PKQ3_9BACT|nr:FliM/FliN family flagellar motor C-terminal domain-containing protein [Roseiconus lacunae]MDM4016771.1 FliM/FliN family flagellar motor C-terminal domain-containing protein [Roseiconus lacunae]
MSDEEKTNEAEAAEDAQTAVEEPTAETDESTGDDIPEFEQLNPNPPKSGGDLDLARFGGVHVTLTAELGRTQLTIEELIGLAEGSVVELNRAISAPVEIVAQGVPMGNGEVVVIDDQFAIRIKQIYST